MADNKLRIEVVTTEKSILEADCDSVSIPAAQGYVTILPSHTPLISLLGVGTLTISEGGKDDILAVAGGFFEISDNVLRVLSHIAERPDEIDVAAAKEAAEAARTEMGGAAGNELTLARRRLNRAEARLAVASA